MSALKRAKLDAEAGNLGSARRRLQSVIGSNGYDAEVCEAIAQTCVAMSDPVEAGRWYFLCDSSDEKAQECIDLFVANCGHNVDQVSAQLPRLKRATKKIEKLSAFPEVVSQRLKCLGGAPVPQRPPKRSRSNISGTLVGFGCLAMLLAGFVCALIGLITIVDWLATK